MPIYSLIYGVFCISTLWFYASFAYFSYEKMLNLRRFLWEKCKNPQFPPHNPYILHQMAQIPPSFWPSFSHVLYSYLENYVNYPYMNLTSTSVIKYTMSRSDSNGEWYHDGYHIWNGLSIVSSLIVLIVQYPKRIQNTRKIMDKITPLTNSIILYFLFPFYFFHFKFFISKFLFQNFQNWKNFFKKNFPYPMGDFCPALSDSCALPPPCDTCAFQIFPMPFFHIFSKIFHCIFIHRLLTISIIW